MYCQLDFRSIQVLPLVSLVKKQNVSTPVWEVGLNASCETQCIYEWGTLGRMNIFAQAEMVDSC